METKLKCHVFICTSCTYEEGKNTIGPSEDLRNKVKEIAKSKWDKSIVRVNKSGCLGKCKKGVASVFYPQEEWITELKLTDSQKIIEKIEDLIK
jgi:predicted metal-binding protein